MSELAKKAGVSLRNKWQDPEYKKTVMKSKIISYVSGLLKAEGNVTPEIYEKNRKME